jgi:hypothetical protein
MLRPAPFARVVGLAALLACQDTMGDAPRAPLRLTPALLAGTYAVRVCRGACDPNDTTRDLRRGTLVLAEHPLDLAQQPDSVQLLLVLDHADPVNGCYVLRYVRDDPPSYADGTVGGSEWELDSTGARLWFSLYASPDAGYEVDARGTPDQLRGQGESWGVGAAEVHYSLDSVVATRIGPPDPGICLAAVGPAWVSIMHPSRHATAENPEHGSR